MMTLEAMRDSGDYPFTFENLDDPDWWRRFPDSVRERITQEEAAHHIQEILDGEEAIRQFILQAASLYKGSGLDRAGIVFLSTDAPDGITAYVKKDHSFAIGLDHSMTVLFSVVFSSLLDSAIRRKENLTWVMALHDFVAKIFAKQYSPAMDQRILERRYAPTIEAFATKATTMAERFLIAHELGHIYLDHPKQRRALLASLTEGADKGAALVKFDQDAEYEADAWGAQLVRRITGTDPLGLALANYVPQIYFGIFSMARQLYVPRDVLGRVLRDSHPDPWERTQRLASQAVSSKNPLDAADYDRHCGLLSQLFSVIADERHNPVFLGAAAVFRRRLAEAPPSPDKLRERLSLPERLQRYSSHTETAAFVRQALLQVNVIYYVASAAALWSRADHPWLSFSISVIGLALAAVCFRLSAYMAAQRWTVAAYGESFGLLPRGGIYIGQAALLLKISAYAFCIAALVLGLMFFLQ
jgi:hypothetical protein